MPIKAEDGTFYIRQDGGGKASARAMDNGSQLPVSHVRYDKFGFRDQSPNIPSCPNLGTGIKYIEGDDKNPDGGGKWRYVYCTEFAKTSPGNGIVLEHLGWAGREVGYALYYGAVYYGQPCRYQPYSTGDWQMDYFVTQVAVHILNGEFTLDAAWNGFMKSSASEAEIRLAYDRIYRMVTDARNPANYGGFTPEGWLDMGNSTFALNGYQDSWYQDGGNYISSGVFHAEFQGYYGYDFKEQLTGYEVRTEEGVQVRKKGEQTYADFDLAVKAEQYKKWQLTGKTVPVNVKASLPRYWGAGIYSSPERDDIQNVCFLTWTSAGGIAEFHQSAALNIPKVTQDLTIDKRDADTGEELSGAKFSLWAFDGKNYSRKAGTFAEQGNGKYVCRGVDYTSTQSGRFLIREDAAPKGYDKNYQKENASDEEDYQRYGGRQIQMTENGFRSDRLSNPLVFRNKKLIPEAELSVMKYDIDNGGNLEGAEFSVYEWDSGKGRYRDEPVQKLVYNKTELKYKTQRSLVKNQGNQGKFLVRETKMPKGYHCPWEKEITVTEPGKVTLELEAPNYPGRNFTVYKKILKEEINWEHGNPTFFFKIAGKDLEGKEHSYHCFIEFTPEQMGQKGEYLTGEATVTDIPAGVYRAEELEDVMRYILTDAGSDQDNVQVEKNPAGMVNGVEKIQAVVTADLRLKDGSVTFTNRKVLYQEYSDNAAVVNHFGAS